MTGRTEKMTEAVERLTAVLRRRNAAVEQLIAALRRRIEAMIKEYDALPLDQQQVVITERLMPLWAMIEEARGFDLEDEHVVMLIHGQVQTVYAVRRLAAENRAESGPAA